LLHTQQQQFTHLRSFTVPLPRKRSIAMTRIPHAAVGHSADIRIRLLIDGTAYDVRQIGGGRLYLTDPITLPHGTKEHQGEVTVTIDGDTRRWAVNLKPLHEPSRVLEATFHELHDAGNDATHR